jgi:hypothetical protein
VALSGMMPYSGRPDSRASPSAKSESASSASGASGDAGPTTSTGHGTSVAAFFHRCSVSVPAAQAQSARGGAGGAGGEGTGAGLGAGGGLVGALDLPHGLRHVDLLVQRALRGVGWRGVHGLRWPCMLSPRLSLRLMRRGRNEALFLGGQSERKVQISVNISGHHILANLSWCADSCVDSRFINLKTYYD